MSKPAGRLDALRAFAASQAWTVAPGKRIEWGEQVVVSDGAHRVVVNYFPRRGHLVPGGAASPLRKAVEEWLNAHPLPAPAPPATAKAAPASASGTPPYPHLGMDESGKGDWFGPLVVAALYADGDAASRLREAGVRDSKTVAGAALREMAAAVAELVPEERRRVRVVWPEEYNRLHAARPNVNHVLRDIYVETARTVWEASPGAGTIVCDQFAVSPALLDDAFKSADLPRPFQRHKAESLSVAVAAASVLATNGFARAMEELGERGGLGGPLPRGASEVRALEKALRTLAAKHGTDALGQYAKLNFRPVQTLLGELRLGLAP